MQPVSLHSLSELERASLQELALYQLQEKLLVGDLSLAKGRGWERTAFATGGTRSEPLLLFILTPALHNVGSCLWNDIVTLKSFVPCNFLFPVLVWALKA